MIEVYTGSRPGQPRRLLLLCAATLAGTLAIAWVQVRASRVLQPPVKIPDSPVSVRPPRGWARDHSDRKPFELRFVPREAARGRLRGLAAALERSVTFSYNPDPGFASLPELVRELREMDYRVTDTSIGPHAGVQYVRPERFLFMGQRIERDTVVRLGILPDGGAVRVEYYPLGFELTPTDMELLDLLCRAVRVEPAARASTGWRTGGLSRWEDIIGGIERDGEYGRSERAA
jgi:hypothetical protein